MLASDLLPTGMTDDDCESHYPEPDDIKNKEICEMKNERIMNVADDLSHMIDVRVEQELRKRGEEERKYDVLRDEVISIVDGAKDSYKAMKENGLSMGTAEAEGYLRCALDVWNIIKSMDGQK